MRSLPVRNPGEVQLLLKAGGRRAPALALPGRPTRAPPEASSNLRAVSREESDGVEFFDCRPELDISLASEEATSSSANHAIAGRERTGRILSLDIY